MRSTSTPSRVALAYGPSSVFNSSDSGPGVLPRSYEIGVAHSLADHAGPKKTNKAANPTRITVAPCISKSSGISFMTSQQSQSCSLI